MGTCANQVGRDAMLEYVSAIVQATNLPVSADLENGFGDSPETVAETIALAAQAGLVGGSIEDATTRAEDPIYEMSAAVERVRAAADAVRSLPHRFTLTARCENFLVGNSDIAPTIERLQAYQEAGADVLYAPGVVNKDDIASLVAAVDRPVNVLLGSAGVNLSRNDLSAIGVKRISVGSALSRAALGAFLRAAREMQEQGTFEFADEAIGFPEINEMFREYS